jgi:hypothetical protein
MTNPKGAGSASEPNKQISALQSELEHSRKVSQEWFERAYQAESRLERAEQDAKRYRLARLHSRMIGNSPRYCSFQVDIPGPPNEHGFVDPGMDADIPECFDAAIDQALGSKE